MKYVTDSSVLDAIDAFGFPGEYVGALGYGFGHINDTYAVYYQMEEGQTRRYLMQRVNTNVFRNPKELMENIVNVTSFLRKKIHEAGGDPDRETLNVLPTKHGDSYYQNYDDHFWRCYQFIEDAFSYQVAGEPAHMYEAGSVFGRFQKLLSDYPADTLHEVIPDFHDTWDRMTKFKKALAEDVCGRAGDVAAEVDFVLQREADTHALTDLLAAGRLPLRVTHNDTKLNNVLMDRTSRKGLCAIDLDTVMPGLSLYDFGDAIRSGANPAPEDETMLSRVRMEMPFYEAYVKGYLSAAGDTLTPEEIRLLPMGAKVMTLECGIRFLTDYLSGDTYFKIHREHHNLDRCRTQFKMVADMEEKWEQMEAVTAP